MSDPDRSQPWSGGLNPATLKPLVNSKLSVPRSGRRMLNRDSLLARMLAERQRRAFVLQSPAGYGKTTALATWCRALAPLGYDVAWLSLDTDDDDPGTWLEYLLASVAKVDAAISSEAMLLDGFGIDQDGIERTVIALVRGVVRHRRELVIAFDDLHHITDARILLALQWLLDYAPENLHLAFTSRAPVPLSLDRLRAQNLTFELNLADLRLTPEEAEHFLKAQLGEVEPASARRLNDLADGWVSGLQLFSLSLKKRRRAVAPDEMDLAIREQVRDASAFSLYFEREVLSKLAPVELDLLTRAAACERFCASLCVALCANDKLDRAGAAQLLERLENDNLFIVPLNHSDRENWYRLHPLLRETLLGRFGSWSDGARREVHAFAWRWFLEHGHLGEAVFHTLKAGEPARAAALIERCAQTLWQRGEMRTLASLVRQLPPDQVQSSPSLRSWVARQQLYHLEFDACEATLRSLEGDLPAQATAERFRIVLLHAALAIERYDVEAAVAALPALLAPPPSVEPVMSAGLRNALSWIYIQCGEYARARDLQMPDAPVSDIDGEPLLGTASGTLTGRCLIGLAHSLEGEVNQAERIYRAVLREAERRGRSCNHAASAAGVLLGELLYEHNQNDAARELLEARVDIVERLGIPDIAERAMLALSGARWVTGHRLDAFAQLDRLEDYATSFGLTRLLGASLAAQAMRRLSLGEFHVAGSCLERLQALDAAAPPRDGSRFDALELSCSSTAIRLHMATGDHERAALLLDRLIDYCTASGRIDHVAPLRLQRAVVDTKLGRPAAARANVVEALSLGHRFGLLRRLLDADPSVLDLVDEAARQAPLDPVLGFYVERLRAAQPKPFDTADTSRADSRRRSAMTGFKVLSERELDVVRLLGEALSTKKIARALGLSPETVKWHLTRIYGKLGVSGRDEAVERMRDMDWAVEPDNGAPDAGR